MMEQQQAPANQITVFYSYAQADERLREQLEKHLSVLQHQGIIAPWHDRQIVPGTDWAREIDAHLATARVILLLISPDFLASDYCYGVELQRAMARHDADEARVIPILLRPVDDWDKAPFARLAVLPTGRKPITKWRNRDDAWTNVVVGIRRAIEELSRLAVSTSRSALPAVWNIPYPRNPLFTGREELLERLVKSLQRGQAMPISQPQALSGLGGIGKTQLAVEYAYRHHHDYQFVLWARAESREALISAFVAIAGLLNLPEQNAQKQMIAVHAVKAWLQKHTGWLLILDNADDLAIIPEFLRPTYGGHVLLTTRARALGLLAQRIEVDTLSSDEGALFLLRRAGLLAPDTPLDQASSHDQERARQITTELGGLPLALHQAGAYIEETGCSLADYQQLYQQRRAELLKGRGMVADHPKSVATTVSLAVQRVEKNNPAAAELLRLCAFLAPDAIAEEIITQGAAHLGSLLGPVAADAFLLNQAIKVLRASSLVQRDRGRKMLSIHRLVQAVLQDMLKEEERRIWVERALLAVNATFPHVDVLQVENRTWPQYGRLLPHTLLAAQFIEEYQMSSAQAGNVLYQTAWYLRVHGRYQEAESLYLRALHIQEQTLGRGHPDVGTSHCGLGVLYDEQGNYVEAEAHYRHALLILEQALGAEHRDVTYSLNGLANLYRKQGKYVEAEPLYQRALHISEQALGPEHPEVAYPLNGLANLYREQGKYAEAEAHYRRALSIQEQTLGLEHPESAVFMHDFAQLWEAQGNTEEARAWYVRALTVREPALGAHHPKTMETRKRLIALLHAMGQHEKATQLEAVQSKKGYDNDS